MESFPNSPLIPKWLTSALGVLLVVFVSLLIVQKASDLVNSARDRKPANTIVVSGQGKVEAVPDLATVNVGVMTQGANATEVKNKNNEKINKIIAYLKQQGLDAKDISTSQFNFYPTQDWTSGVPRVTGYQGNQIITVKVRGVDESQEQLEKVLGGVVEQGANEIQGVSFTFDKAEDLRQQARKDAIAQAKEKAEELATTAGLTLGKVVSVSESGGEWNPLPYASDAVGRGGANSFKEIAPDVLPGTQNISATVTMTFEVR